MRGPYLTASLASLALATINTTRRTSATAYERGSNGIGMYTSSLEAIFEAEHENICRLFSSTSWAAVYHGTTASAMAVFKRTVQDLSAFIGRNMATDLFLAYEIIECVQPASMRLKAKTGEQREFTDALKPVRLAAQASFAFVLDDLKRQGQALVTLPLDHGVAELARDSMARLRALADYQPSVAGLLVALGDGNWKRPHDPQSAATPASTPGSLDVGADGSLLLSHFLLDVVDQLISELDHKAQALLKKKSHVAVFMVNNVAYIEAAIRRSDLVKIMTAPALAKVERWRKDAVKLYMEAWKECAAFLMDVTYTAKQAGKGLTGKEKEGVKDKFKVSLLTRCACVRPSLTYLAAEFQCGIRRPSGQTQVVRLPGQRSAHHALQGDWLCGPALRPVLRQVQGHHQPQARQVRSPAARRRAGQSVVWVVGGGG